MCVFNCTFIFSCSGSLSVCNLDGCSLGSCSCLIPWATEQDAWAQETEEGKEGGREKKGAGERAGALESVTCVTRGAGAICPTNTELIRVIVIAVSATAASCERAGKGRSLHVCAEPSLRRAFGEGAVLLGKPSGPRTPGAHQAAASSAAAQPKPRVAPASLAQWLRRAQSAVSEQKPLLG